MKLTEENYVEIAEKAIKSLKGKKDKWNKPIQPVTTSKIRNLLAMTADIYNEVVDSNNSNGDKLSADIVGQINYMKIRFIYEAGREERVKDLIEAAEILDHLDEIRGSRAQYILFSRYMEALVAYRKFYFDKDE